MCGSDSPLGKLGTKFAIRLKDRLPVLSRSNDGPGFQQRR